MNFPFSLSEALKSGVFISGITQSGKTNLALLIAKHLIDQAITVFAFDPSRAWHKLKHHVDSLVIDNNTHQLAYDPKRSTLFDISLLLVEQQKEVVQKVVSDLFMNALENKKHNPTIVFFEEAQLYLPQGSLSAKVSQEILRLITVGGNFKLRYVLITPFASSVDKSAIKACKQKYLGFSDEPNDVRYLKSFLAKRVYELKTLNTGEFLYVIGDRVEKVKTPLFA